MARDVIKINDCREKFQSTKYYSQIKPKSQREPIVFFILELYA